MAETARRVGLSKVSVWRWCHGRGEPTLASLRKLCGAFGISLETFLTVLPEERG